MRKTPRTRLLTDLLIERYGPIAAVERERPPTPAELERRRKVLCGDDEKEHA